MDPEIDPNIGTARCCCGSFVWVTIDRETDIYTFRHGPEGKPFRVTSQALDVAEHVILANWETSQHVPAIEP